MHVQLPDLRCNEVHLNYNYTFVVTNEKNETILTLGPSICTRAGRVSRNITTNLTQNENYALKVVMTTCSGSHTFISPQHYFGKTIGCVKCTMYMSTIGVGNLEP